MKLPRKPAGPAAARGQEAHGRVEAYIKGEIDNVDPPAGVLFGDKRPAPIHRKYIPIFNEFKNHPNGAVHVEYKLGFDHDWYLTSPISTNTSCVMILDAVRAGGAWTGVDKGADDGIVRIGEWKTGKPKATHGDQRKMYALGGLKKWMAEKVEVTTYYLEDTHPPQQLVVTKSALPKLESLWSERRDLMIRDEMCAPRPGHYCNWCDYASSKNGPCKFG